jgi:hypothetical protein
MLFSPKSVQNLEFYMPIQGTKHTLVDFCRGFKQLIMPLTPMPSTILLPQK